MSDAIFAEASNAAIKERGATLSIKGVSRRFGAATAVDTVSLDVEAGEFISLLGPSGSGKTTLLMMIAGFEFPDAGTISIGDRDVTMLEPNLRGIGMVFQKYALFPHMTVRENVGFALRMRRLNKVEIKFQVDAALAMVRLSGYDDRRPEQLSGGQQQRVALARATVFDPPMILMDEPLGALDKKLRDQMQIEIKALQRKLGATVVYVTHDQQEALAMSDRIAVMNTGRIEQVSSPRDLYDNPESIFVADFIGDTNLIEGTVQAINDEIAVLDLGMGLRVCGRIVGDRSTLKLGTTATLSIRPEYVRLVLEGNRALPLRREDQIFAGQQMMVVGKLGDKHDFRFIQKSGKVFLDSDDDFLFVEWDPADAIIFSGGRSGG